MNEVTATREDITCKELVELVTDYLEGALSKVDHDFFEQHVAGCGKCGTYLDQIKLTVAAAGALSEDAIEPAARDELLGAFRGWHNR